MRMRRIPHWLTAVLLAIAVVVLAATVVMLDQGPVAGSLLATVGRVLATIWTTPFFEVGDFKLTARLIVQTGAVLILLWLGTKVAGRILRGAVLDKTHLNEGMKFSIERVTSYMLFAFGALVCVQAIGIDLSSVTVFSGALGIGIGLGFQTIAKEFASGLVLLFEHPVKVGDRVQVGDLLGDIVQIGARGTWIKTNENIVLIVPNSEFIEGRVTNWTANDREVRIAVPLGVSYGADPEHVRRVLMRVAGENPDVLDQPAPHVAFIGFGDSSLDFHLRVWTSQQVTRPRLLRSGLYFAIFAAFKEEGIEIPFPQRDVHLKTLPPAGLSVNAPRRWRDDDMLDAQG